MTLKITMELWDDEAGEFVPVDLPARYEVCPRCDGHGTQCKLGAMTGSEYQEMVDGDPDFPDDYKRGVYDDVCSECGGKRVVEEVEMDLLTPDMRKRVEDHFDAEAERAAEIRYQQRYGF